MKDAAAMIILCNGRALILLRGAGAPWQPLKWNLPGGEIEEGESPLQTALRECQEETGLAPISVEYMTEVSDPEGWRLVLYKAHHVADQRVMLNPEHDALCWVSGGELDAYPFVPQVKDLLREVLEQTVHVG